MEHTKPCLLVVSFEPPHFILEVRLANRREILGFHDGELRGNSIQNFHGPQTNMIEVSSVILNAKSLKSATIQTELYDKKKQCHTMIANFSPFRDESGHLIGCLMSMEPSRAIALDKALEDTSCAKILILMDTMDTGSLQYSGYIQMVSQEFAREFRISPAQLLGQPIQTLCSLCTEPSQLSALITTSAAGRTACRNLVMQISSNGDINCSISCFPVVEEVSCRIAHVLIIFTLATTPPDGVPIAMPHQRERDLRHLSTGGSGGGGGSSSGGGSGGDPRRLAKAAISAEMLRGMGHLPMPRAAEQLGMSVSSLKALCRAHGIKRWPRAILGPGPSSASAGPVVDVDVAYLRRLCRKYRPKSAQPDSAAAKAVLSAPSEAGARAGGDAASGPMGEAGPESSGACRSSGDGEEAGWVDGGWEEEEEEEEERACGDSLGRTDSGEWGTGTDSDDAAAAAAAETEAALQAAGGGWGPAPTSPFEPPAVYATASGRGGEGDGGGGGGASGGGEGGIGAGGGAGCGWSPLHFGWS